ncbi:GGDEF domain-containing protein [Klebsiella variicola]|nr:GGDEF domain-containing protein [Klebsiella variicola]
MFSKKPFLRPLLISLTAGGVILTSVLLLGIMLFFQKKEIENSLLESNLAYAMKLADSTDRYLAFAQRELAATALQLHSADPSQARTEITLLHQRSGAFNSVVVVSAQGMIIATSPDLPALTGVKIHSEANRQALSAQRPLIYGPFTSVAGNMMIMISHPVRAQNGNYLGYIGGSIYLKKQSMLSDILSIHFYKNNVSVTIVDNDGRIVFTTAPMETSDVFLAPPFSEAQKKDRKGVFIGQDSLVGYARLTDSEWSVFVSTPCETVTNMLRLLGQKIAGIALAILFLIVGGVAFLSSRIARPLEQLAKQVRATDGLTSLEKLSAIRAWYQEADLLREAMENRFRSVSARFAVLSDEAMTDPLTGLYNRRGFHDQAACIAHHKNQYAIAIDVDHFKAINDRFGHKAGDVALVRIADLLRLTCRKGDIISRFGGEEFIVLLLDSSLSGATAIAERIRLVMAGSIFPEVGHLTVSIGVAGLQESGGIHEHFLREADLALYQAKRQGRNRVVVK